MTTINRQQTPGRDEGPADPARRGFMVRAGASVAALAAPALADHDDGPRPDHGAVLVDLTVCVGCRRCEWACARANGLEPEPFSSLDDASVFDAERQPAPNRLTVVNRRPPAAGTELPVHVKTQCMHCERPACVSACLVGAMQKQADGAVTYDASRCIGCRYCLVACPFQNAAYEYENALTPQVRKCSLCHDRTGRGELPACVDICPVEALRYGRRDELLALAHERIDRHPDRYVNHVYGEHEAGGTSWLYLSSQPFTDLGFPALGSDSPADLSEAIQHGIFRGLAAPLLLAGLLLTAHRVSRSGTGAPEASPSDARPGPGS